MFQRERGGKEGGHFLLFGKGAEISLTTTRLAKEATHERKREEKKNVPTFLHSFLRPGIE